MSGSSVKLLRLRLYQEEGFCRKFSGCVLSAMDEEIPRYRFQTSTNQWC